MAGWDRWRGLHGIPFLENDLIIHVNLRVLSTGLNMMTDLFRLGTLLSGYEFLEISNCITRAVHTSCELCSFV